MMTKRGCGPTSRGLRRPPPVALGSCRPLESSNWCQNKFSHTPKPQNPKTPKPNKKRYFRKLFNSDLLVR